MQFERKQSNVASQEAQILERGRHALKVLYGMETHARSKTSQYTKNTFVMAIPLNANPAKSSDVSDVITSNKNLV